MSLLSPGPSRPEVSLNATFSLGTSYGQRGSADYAHRVVDQEGSGQGGYSEDFSQGDQVDYGVQMADDFQDEVLDLQINDPLDGDFQVSHSLTHSLLFSFSQKKWCIKQLCCWLLLSL